MPQEECPWVDKCTVELVPLRVLLEKQRLECLTSIKTNLEGRGKEWGHQASEARGVLGVEQSDKNKLWRGTKEKACQTTRSSLGKLLREPLRLYSLQTQPPHCLAFIQEGIYIRPSDVDTCYDTLLIPVVVDVDNLLVQSILFLCISPSLFERKSWIQTVLMGSLDLGRKSH